LRCALAKRSITEKEISLIKAMRARGMKNKDIQFFFNRPERAVNSGRISGIANGTYGDSAAIAAATDDEVEKFLATPQSAAAKEPAEEQTPLAEANLRSMFARDSDGTWRLRDGESDTRECKTNFGLKHAHQWIKAIAALANNRGGHIFFGVADGSHKGASGEDLTHAVVGLTTNDFESVDPVDITSKLKAVLDPTPRIERTVIDFNGKRVGVIHVEQHVSRPVIATKGDGDKIREGDIFYRYPGQTSRIKYSDLRGVLDARDTQARLGILPLVERLLALGPQRALLADLENGELHDGTKAIMIDPALVDQIKFIREGSFDEVAGAPTLKLVGDVLSSNSAAVGSRGAITDVNLLRNFLKQATISQPREYIRYAAGAGHATWLPLRYFAKKGSLDREGTVAVIQGADGTKTRKSSLISNLKNDRAAFKLYEGAPKPILAKLKLGEVPDPSDIKSASHLAQAICGLESLSPPSGPLLLEVLERWRSQVEQGHNCLSYFRRAACRLDELMFPFTEPDGS